MDVIFAIGGKCVAVSWDSSSLFFRIMNGNDS
jgi:hypothetical protein